MPDSTFKYRVDSPIKFGGKRHEPGDSILLTEEQADGLHVTQLSGDPVKADASGSKGTSNQEPEEIDLGKGSRAHDDWRAVVEFIEATPYEELAEAGFVGKDEDRTSVQKAWQAKQKAEKGDEAGDNK